METIKITVFPGPFRGKCLWINTDTNTRLNELAQKANVTASGLGDYLLNVAMDNVELTLPGESKE